VTSPVDIAEVAWARGGSLRGHHDPRRQRIVGAMVKSAGTGTDKDESLKRLGGGRWQTRDERFTIEPQSGTWVVVDAEQTDDLGLPLVRGPFGSLGAAKTAIEGARGAEPAASPLAAKMRDRPASRPDDDEERPRKDTAPASKPGGAVTDATAKATKAAKPGRPAKPEPPTEPRWMAALEPAVTSSARSRPRRPSPSPARSRPSATTPRPRASPGCSRAAGTTTLGSAGTWSTVTAARSRSTSTPDHMDEFLSTREMAWVLGRSPSTIRDMIRDGEIDGVRLADGFRVPKPEALRVARERIEAEAGRKLSDRELERLIDEVITTNEQRA
jgi:excisionase family DNA binding protein